VAHDDGKSPEAHLAMKARMPGGSRQTITSLTVMVKAAETWPTPRSSPNENRQTKPSPSQLAGTHGMSLGVAVNLPGQWPTPRAEHDSGGHRGTKDTLHSAVKGWPTPAAHEARLGFQDRTRGKKGSQESLSTVAMRPQGGAGTAPLNPAWVEHLMGFPSGWTELPATHPLLQPKRAGPRDPAKPRTRGKPRAPRSAS